MPDLSPVASSRNTPRYDDESGYDLPPGFAERSAVAKLDAPQVAGLAPVKPPPAGHDKTAQPALPEAPRTALSPRAFANPALGASAQQPRATTSPTVAELQAWSAVCRRAADEDPSAPVHSFPPPGTPALTEDQRRVLAEVCPKASPAYSGPAAGTDPGTGILLRDRQTAIAQQIAIQRSVAENPLSAVVSAAGTALGSTRDTVYNETRIADATWAMAAAVAVPIVVKQPKAPEAELAEPAR